MSIAAAIFVLAGAHGCGAEPPLGEGHPGAVIELAAAAAPTSDSLSTSARDDPSESTPESRGAGWVLPWRGAAVERRFEPPAHEYAPGHRGVELRGAPPGVALAPAAGTVAFSGSVAGRGVVTIDHGDGLVTTLEPVDASVAPGTPVRRGDVVGTVGVGGDTAPGALHFGVRLDGSYVDPMLLIGDIERAVLLPCC